MPSPFQFLVIEGSNGVGKSTIVEYLKHRTGGVSFHYPPEFLKFRRKMRLDESLEPLPRLSYYLAATLHLSDLVREQLAKGHVICDRYLASPLSLMIGESVIKEEKAQELVAPFLPYLRFPDVTLLLTSSYPVACARIRNRMAKSGTVTPVAQRMLESQDLFRGRNEACRRWSAKLSPVVELDTTHLSSEQMCDAAWSLLAPALNW